jgi:transcription elongation factor Elf1
MIPTIKFAQKIMRNISNQMRLEHTIRSVMAEYGHDCMFTAITHESMAAQCSRCGQILAVRINPMSKPWLFGRSSWKDILLEGGAGQMQCMYLQRLISTLRLEHVRETMEA